MAGDAGEFGDDTLGLAVLLVAGLFVLETGSAGMDGAVETGDLGGDVQLVTSLGVGFPFSPQGLLFGGGSPLPPAGAVLRLPLGMLAGDLCLLEVMHGPAGFVVVVDAGASIEVGSGIECITASCPEAERQRRAECARKAYYAALAAKSAKARRIRRETKRK